MQNWNQESQQQFFRNLSQTIITVTGQSSHLNATDYPSFRNLIYGLVQTHGYRFVLILDEFEGMASNPNFDATFFTNMRALGVSPEYGFGYLTASRRSLAELSRDHSIESSAFWNIFDPKVMGTLTDAESRALVREPLSRSLLPASCPDTDQLWLNAIHPFTGGHPALIQLVTSIHWSGLDGGYDPDPLDIETTVRPHLEDLWHRRSPEEAALLIQAAVGHALSRSYLVTDLIQRGLLRREGKPLCDQFVRVMAESLPVGKSLTDAANDLAQGPKQAAQLLDQIATAARGPVSPHPHREDPGQDLERDSSL